VPLLFIANEGFSRLDIIRVRRVGNTPQGTCIIDDLIVDGFVCLFVWLVGCLVGWCFMAHQHIMAIYANNDGET
jgi:hypothetical protein